MLDMREGWARRRKTMGQALCNNSGQAGAVLGRGHGTVTKSKGSQPKAVARKIGERGLLCAATPKRVRGADIRHGLMT